MVELFNGDCLEIMKSIPDKSIDMILCDLPYGTTQNKWDCAIDLEKMWVEYKRIIKDNGVIALFSQLPFTADLVYSNKKMFRYEWIWKKSNATGFLNANRMPMKSHENILIFYKKLPTYNPQKKWVGTTHKSHHAPSSNYGKYKSVETVSDGYRFPIDILEFTNGVRTGQHPTQKPVPLLEYLIKTYTNENELVLDNCMGNGSTGVACVNTNRNFIGIELDENYFEIAKNRIITD